MFREINGVKSRGTYLESQHSGGGWGRQVSVSSGPAWSTYKFQDSQNYRASDPVSEKKIAPSKYNIYAVS